MLEFILQNWYLFLALGVISALILYDPLSRRSGGIRSISSMELSRLVSHESGVVVDVSTADEFREGHIHGSVSAPSKDLEKHLPRLKKYRKKPVVVVCQAGNLASRAAGKLKKSEFEQLHVLSGGLVNWRKDNLPLEKG